MRLSFSLNNFCQNVPTIFLLGTATLTNFPVFPPVCYVLKKVNSETSTIKKFALIVKFLYSFCSTVKSQVVDGYRLIVCGDKSAEVLAKMEGMITTPYEKKVVVCIELKYNQVIMEQIEEDVKQKKLRFDQAELRKCR